MSRLFDRAQGWWAGRTLRERRMLMVMAALIVGTALWLGLVSPVMAWREAAADRAAGAAADLARTRTAVTALKPTARRTAPSGEGLEPLVRRTADAAGLPVTTTMSAAGQLGFQASGVRSGPLFAWLSALETDHQIEICSLGVVENADATLNAEGALSSGGCGG